MYVEIYTKDGCDYCIRTKKLLESRKISYKEYHLDRDFTKELLTEKYASARTYPVVVVDGFFIGGYNELTTKLLESDMQSSFLTE